MKTKQLEDFARNIVALIDDEQITKYSEARKILAPLVDALDAKFVYNIGLGTAIDDWLEYLEDGNTQMANHQRRIVVEDLDGYFE